MITYEEGNQQNIIINEDWILSIFTHTKYTVYNTKLGPIRMDIGPTSNIEIQTYIPKDFML